TRPPFRARAPSIGGLCLIALASGAWAAIKRRNLATNSFGGLRPHAVRAIGLAHPLLFGPLRKEQMAWRRNPPPSRLFLAGPPLPPAQIDIGADFGEGRGRQQSRWV